MVRYCIQHESTGINPSCSITKESSAWNVLWYMKLQEIIFSPFEFESLNVDNCILCPFRENKWVEENLKRTFYLFLPQEPIDRHRSSSWDHQQSAVIILWRFAQPYSYSALAATEVMKYYMLFKKMNGRLWNTWTSLVRRRKCHSQLISFKIGDLPLWFPYALSSNHHYCCAVDTYGQCHLSHL